MTNTNALARALRRALDDTGEVAAPARALAATLPEGHPARTCAEKSAALAESILNETCPEDQIDQIAEHSIAQAEAALEAYWL